MAGWPLLTNGQLFSLLMLAQFMIHFTIEGAPVHPPPVSAAGNSVFPECYSVVQTAQPALYSVLTPNVVPVAYAVHWSQEFHPGTLITNHLVPNTQQTPPHNIDPGSALRSDAIPYEPQEPKKQIYKKQDPARVKNAVAQKTRASGQVNARTASRAFVPVGRSPVGNVPSALGVKTNLPVPVSSSVAPLTDGERSEKMSKESCFPSPRNIEQSGIEKQSEPPIYATQKRTEQNEFCQILAQAGILLPETKIQHTHDSVLREEKDATTRIHNYGILNQNSANIPPRADLNSVHDTAETKPNSAKKNVREYGMESPVGLPTASVAVLPSTQRDDFKDVVGASKEIKSEDLKKPETSLEKTAGVPQSPRADALPSTATVELDVIPSSDTHRLKDDVHGPKSSLNIMRDQKISSASLKSGGDVLSPVSVGKIPAASAQRKSSSDVKTSDSTTNRKGIPQSKREEVLSSSNTIRDQNIEVGKKRSPDSSIMQTPTKPTAKGGDEGVGGDLATPRAEDRNKIAPKINLKSPTLNPVENEIRLATPVESYKSTLLKNFSPSDVGDRAEGMKESVEQMGPSLPAHAISDSERKPTKKNLNDPVYLKNDEAKNGTPLTFKNPSDSVPRTVQPSDQLSASTETTSRISKGNNVFKETPMISGTNKFGSDVGVMISKKKAQLNHSHSKKFPWEILNSDLESHTDSTFSDSENFTEEVPANENSSPEKLKEEPQNDSQYDTKDSQEVEIMEKESRPRKSSGERKKKSKKLKKAQPETVKNTWGSTKDDEENVGKRNGKSQMTNPEKLKKGYEEKQGIGSRQVASESENLEAKESLLELRRKAQWRRDKERLLIRILYLAFQPASHLPEDEIFPGIKNPTITMLQGRSTQCLLEDSKMVNEGKENIVTSECKLLAEEKALEKLLKTWNPDWINKWKEEELDLNFMDKLSKHLQVRDNCNYLPLRDMSLETYQLFREIWINNPKTFLLGQFWASKILGVQETYRRLKSMVKQISEMTLVENWKVIKDELVNQKQLTKTEAEKIEKFYNLSILFPNPINYSPKLSLQILEKKKKDVLSEIEKCLGISDSKRPYPIQLNISSNQSKISDLKHELYLASRYNGINISKIKEVESNHGNLFHFEALFNSSKSEENLQSLLEEFISWENSAERNWLSEKTKIPLDNHALPEEHVMILTPIL